MTRRIESIRAVAMPDESPDVSWIGEYSSNPGSPEKTKKRFPDDDRRRSREYQYFISCNAENRQQAHEDWRRMEALARGEWRMVGVYVTARIAFDHGTYTTFQHLRSPGLWGIESDSSPEYFTEIARGEFSCLSDELQALGFTAEEIASVDFDPTPSEA